MNAPEELALPYVLPLRAESLADLAPALLICAAVDPLLEESAEYVRRLKASGVPVEMRIYPGCFTGSGEWLECSPEARHALDFAGEQTREAMLSVS